MIGVVISPKREMLKRHLNLSILEPAFAVCRLDKAHPDIARSLEGPFSSLSVTEDEVSLVCVESAAPQGADVEGGWRCLKVEGPLNFSEVGILSSLTTTLAEAGVSLFAVSTWETDYLMVKEESLAIALEVLGEAGHNLS